MKEMTPGHIFLFGLLFGFGFQVAGTVFGLGMMLLKAG